jgi:ORF6N domain
VPRETLYPRDEDLGFPDFMFALSQEEFAALISQNATSKGRGGRRKLPHVFTEHGAIMAANVLNSGRAIEVGVYVVRAFVRLREMVATNKEVAARVTPFDYGSSAERVGIRPEDLARLIAVTRAECPCDEMMVELHVVRTILALERGDVTLEEILHPERWPDAVRLDPVEGSVPRLNRLNNSIDSVTSCARPHASAPLHLYRLRPALSASDPGPGQTDRDGRRMRLPSYTDACNVKP